LDARPQDDLRQVQALRVHVALLVPNAPDAGGDLHLLVVVEAVHALGVEVGLLLQYL
jgi:hypothetical protein